VDGVGCLVVRSDGCTSSAMADRRLQTGRWVAAGPVGGKCVRQKGKKIDSQQNVACFEISFILLT
jgi:hypothetical protein